MYFNQLRAAVNERRELLSKQIVLSMGEKADGAYVDHLTLSELENLWMHCQKNRTGQKR